MEERHGSYVIKTVKEIGRGGFGFVEQVEIFNIDGVRCGDYAKKVLSPAQGLNKEDFRRRFKREVDYQARCVHSHIAPIYLHNLKVENPWFVMDLAKGDLSADLASGKLSNKDKMNIVDMILSGVRFMHEESVDDPKKKPTYLHRDLKPSNVLRFENNVYRISDFGLVKNAGKEAESEILTKVAMAMGTAKYMAPEISAAGLYSVQTDIFALGVMLDEMDLKGVNGIKQVVDKCTSWRPTGRYQSVEEMAHDLNNIRVRNGL